MLNCSRSLSEHHNPEWRWEILHAPPRWPDLRNGNPFFAVRNDQRLDTHFEQGTAERCGYYVDPAFIFAIPTKSKLAPCTPLPAVPRPKAHCMDQCAAIFQRIPSANLSTVGNSAIEKPQFRLPCCTSHLQYEARLSPGSPKLGWRRHPTCWQRRDVTFTILASLWLAQYDARRSP